MKKFLADVKAKVDGWRSTEFHCIYLCKTQLFYLGLWSEKAGARGVGVAARTAIRSLVHSVTAYSLFIGHTILAYRSLGKDLHLAVEEIASVFYASLVFTQIRCLLYGSERTERLFLAMKEMKRCSDQLPLQSRAILEQTRRWSEHALLYVIVSVTGLLVSFQSVPHLIATRSFMYRLWYPVDEQKSPYYEIFFILVFINHALAFLVMVTFNFLFMALLVQLIGHFRLLRCNLQEIFQVKPSAMRPIVSNRVHEIAMRWKLGASQGVGRTDFCRGTVVLDMNYRERAISRETMKQRRAKDASDFLRICVRHHHAILNFVNEINTTFNLILFVQFLATLVPTSLAISLVIFAENFETRTVTYLTLATAGFAGTGIFCWLANQVTEESELVRDAVFGSDWLLASEGAKRSLRIIMSRANQPVVIRVAGFIALSVETFYSVMKLTYSYFMASWTYFNQREKQ